MVKEFHLSPTVDPGLRYADRFKSSSSLVLRWDWELEREEYDGCCPRRCMTCLAVIGLSATGSEEERGRDDTAGSGRGGRGFVLLVERRSLLSD